MRNSLHRHVLRKLDGVSIGVKLVTEGCDGAFLPVSRSKLMGAIKELLQQSGVKVVGDLGFQPQLITEVRIRFAPDAIGLPKLGVAKIETVLREPVTIARNAMQTSVDTWRHRVSGGVFSGQSQMTDLAELLEGEVLRQVEDFIGDIIGPADDQQPPPNDSNDTGNQDQPPPPPQRLCIEKALGSLPFGVPEFKTEMETQCRTVLGVEVCADVPVLYRRTSQKTAIAVVCGPSDLIGQAKREIEECAASASASATVAAIVASPEAALPAFTSSFMPCLQAKLSTRAAEIDVTLKVKTDSGEWKRSS